MTVSLVEILAAARAHAAPLAAESAGYLLLAVADHVVSAPRVVEADDVELSSDGRVTIRGRRGGVVSTDGAEQAVRQLLSRTLALSSSVGPALRRAAERREDAGLGALVRELEVALIPVNRSAAKRALSRVHRETERARDSGKLQAWLRAEAAPAPAPAVPEVVTAPATTVVAQVLVAAEYPDVSPEPPPAVRPSAKLSRPPAPPVELTLTPEPQLAVGEPTLTKPEPVVLRAKERGSSTPRLGTVVTAQTLQGEELERTERAPSVEELEVALEPATEVALEEHESVALEPAAEIALEPAVEVALEPAVEVALEEIDGGVLEPGVEIALAPETEVENVVALGPQPLVDPEPSRMPDVLSAMLELHTGMDADDAPTRLRDVVTAPVALLPNVTAVPMVPVLTPEPEQVEDAWLTESSLVSLEVEEPPVLFVSERVAPELHEALTWDPGPVVTSFSSPPTPALTIAEPLLEPSPYAPAVLPARSSDVSELLDSFYVSGAAEERELRSALGEMAGIELTPMPHSVFDKR